LRDRLLSRFVGGKEHCARDPCPFEQKLSEFSAPETTQPPEIESFSASSQESASVPGSQDIGTSKGADQQQSSGIDKSVLAVSAPRRYRNKESSVRHPTAVPPVRPPLPRIPGPQKAA
jgi:hypothetical protein